MKKIRCTRPNCETNCLKEESATNYANLENWLCAWNKSQHVPRIPSFFLGLPITSSLSRPPTMLASLCYVENLLEFCERNVFTLAQVLNWLRFGSDRLYRTALRCEMALRLSLPEVLTTFLIVGWLSHCFVSIDTMKGFCYSELVRKRCSTTGFACLSRRQMASTVFHLHHISVYEQNGKFVLHSKDILDSLYYCITSQ